MKAQQVTSQQEEAPTRQSVLDRLREGGSDVIDDEGGREELAQLVDDLLNLPDVLERFDGDAAKYGIGVALDALRVNPDEE